MTARSLRMLAACEMSCRVRDAFAARGWDACSCDLEPPETPGQHVQADVLSLLRDLPPGHFDLVVSFPPCDDLALAGARWWAAKQADGRQQAAARFFMAMTTWPAPHWAIENPRGIMTRLYRPPDQVVEPWWFGDPYAKKTCLWTHGLPPLIASDPVTPTGRVATGGGSHRTDKAAGRTAMSRYEDGEGRKNRRKVRSRTMPGFARAMAAQWGAYVEGLERMAA